MSSPPAPGALREVGWLFLKLGCISFGGPAAHTALMREELVRRRGWLDDQRFLDLMAASAIIPGPNSTELAIHIGYQRAGWRGLLLAGLGFIMPAVVIVLAIVWAYDRYGTLPAARWLLYGVSPVIVAVVAQALWALGKVAVKGRLTAAVGLAVLALYLLGGNEIALLFGGGLVVALVANARRLRASASGAAAVAPLLGWPALGLPAVATAASPSVLSIFLVFLKIGSVLFGSGYVLLAFLRADLVDRLGWLTDQQLIDAIAVGQFTPGPMFTTATFIGYLLGGVAGAGAATAGIFLPAFVFVALTAPVIPLLRRSPWVAAFLDGLNVASLALMAVVTAQIGRAALIDPLTVLLALAAGTLLIRWRVNSAWLVLGGAVIGFLWQALTR